jgi:hypothetical protein
MGPQDSDGGPAVGALLKQKELGSSHSAAASLKQLDAGEQGLKFRAVFGVGSTPAAFRAGALQKRLDSGYGEVLLCPTSNRLPWVRGVGFRLTSIASKAQLCQAAAHPSL